MPRVGSSWRRRRRKPTVSSSSARMSGPSPAEALVEAGPRLGHQLEHGPVELDHLVLGGADHEPGATRAPPPALAPPVDAPRPAHAQVGVEREVTVEAQEQMLAVGVHGPHGAAAQPLGPAVHGVPALRSLDLLDRASHQSRADAVGRVVDRVAFGHDALERCTRHWRHSRRPPR